MVNREFPPKSLLGDTVLPYCTCTTPHSSLDRAITYNSKTEFQELWSLNGAYQGIPKRSNLFPLFNTGMCVTWFRWELQVANKFVDVLFGDDVCIAQGKWRPRLLNYSHACLSQQVLWHPFQWPPHSYQASPWWRPNLSCSLSFQAWPSVFRTTFFRRVTPTYVSFLKSRTMF